MKNLIAIIMLAVFGIIIVCGILGFAGAVLGLTFGALGAVIGLVCRIIFSPLILVLIAGFVIFLIFGRRAAK